MTQLLDKLYGGHCPEYPLIAYWLSNSFSAINVSTMLKNFYILEDLLPGLSKNP